MDKKPLLGLAGMVVAVSFSELNGQVVSAALPDISGGLGIGYDAAQWIRTVYVTGLVIGMALGPSLAVIFSTRHFILFAIALAFVTSLLIPFSPSLALVFLWRFLQGVGEAFIISNLIAVALRVLDPPIRLYGLAFYAMTATLIPSLATPLAALWLGVLNDWRLVFLEAIALAPLAALLVWFGMPQEDPQYGRLASYDWIGVVLVILGFGSFAVIVQEGNHYDWFNSTWVCLATVLAGVALPLFLLVETQVEVPLIRIDLLARRNFAYSATTLVLFLIISLSASQIPITFLQEVQGYRPLQSEVLSLAVGVPQLVLLPAVAFLLDFAWIDSRWVSAAGLLCILGACVLGTGLTSTWNSDQFLLLQGLQAIGQPMVVMPLLMMATNALTPDEGPFASALVNAPRALSQAAGAGVMALIMRERGSLHRTQILDHLGQVRLDLLQIGHLPASIAQAAPGGHGPAGGALEALNAAVRAQVATLATIDAYVAMGGLAVVVLIILAVLPVRTYPPRIALAKK